MSASFPLQSNAPRYEHFTCPKCKVVCEVHKPSTYPVSVECHACNVITPFSSPPTSPTPTASRSPPTSSGAGKRSSGWGSRGTGTDEKPASMEYYDLLEIPADATQATIKKQYYRLAMKYHPDKNKEEGSEERFKQISKAYQVLSDPALRKRYNQTGNMSDSPEGGFVDPAEFFKQQFGGERFVDIIGNIGLAQDFADMVEERDGAEGSETSAVEAEGGSGSVSPPLDAEGRRKKEEQLRAQQAARDAAHAERVRVLTENLTRKLNVYVKNGESPESIEAFTEIQRVEADDLKEESYGVQLLHAIGYTYTIKAQQHLGKSGWGGIQHFYHSMREKTNIMSETVSTIRTAVDLQRSFAQLQAAEKEGTLTDEERIKLEALATEQGMKALWKGSKLEVQSVLREVCDNVLGDKSLPKSEARKRAAALKIVGETYMGVKTDKVV